MLTFLLASLACLIGKSLQDIVPIQADNMTVYSRDTVTVNMTDLFDLSAASQNVTFTPNVGKLVTYQTHVNERDISGYNYGYVDFVHFVDNRSYVAIFDESHLLARTISLDGQTVTKEVFFNFTLPGANLSCSDIDVNTNMSRYYLACFETTTQENLGKIWLFEIDTLSGELLKSHRQDMTDDFSIQHTLRVAIMPVKQQNVDQRVLVLYDQGLSATNTTKNFWLAVFTNVDSGSDLVFDGFVDLKDSHYPLTSFFDAFSYNHKVVITGFQQSQNLIFMINCNLQPSPLSLECGEPIKTTINYGFVGFMNTGQLAFVDLSQESGSITVCSLNGPIEQQTFGPDNCVTHLDIESIDNAFVTEVVGNSDVLLIKYDHPDGEYAGHTVLTTTASDLAVEWVSKDEKLHATVINKQVHYITSRVTWTQNMLRPRLLFDSAGDKLTPGNNSIQVQAIDTNTQQQAVNNFNIYLMQSIYDDISFDPSYLPDFNAYEGASYDIWLSQQIIKGNDLNYTVTFQDDVKQYVIPFVFDTKNIAIVYRSKTAGSTFKEVTMFKQSAIVVDQRNNLVLFTCEQTDSLVICTEKANRVIHPTETLMKRCFQLFEYTVAWTKNSTHTMIYLFDTDGTIYTHSFEDVAADLVVTQLDMEGYIVASFPQTGVLKHYSMHPWTPYMFTALPDVGQPQSFSEFFCPTSLFFCPFGPNVLEVLSACTGQADRRMLKYSYYPA